MRPWSNKDREIIDKMIIRINAEKAKKDNEEERLKYMEDNGI